jgi:hypothetical protein
MKAASETFVAAILLFIGITIGAVATDAPGRRHRSELRSEVDPMTEALADWLEVELAEAVPDPA